jgi:molybdate transport system ATP-binding protein
VVEVRPLPDRLRVTLDAGALIAADVTREAAARLGLGPGRALWASVKATAMRVYG